MQFILFSYELNTVPIDESFYRYTSGSSWDFLWKSTNSAMENHINHPVEQDIEMFHLIEGGNQLIFTWKILWKAINSGVE